MKRLVGLSALLWLALACFAHAQQLEKRIALVIGNAGYQAGTLATAANDAGLIAQTLQAAGFDVAGARDLDQDTLRRALRDFVEKAEASGPGTVAYIYFSGHALQLEGENYLVPVDARITRDSDVPAAAIRISDYTRALAALKLKATIVVLDAARPNTFARSGAPLAGGLALVEPESGMLIAFNAAPGTIAPEAAGPYGPYAQALAEMMREGGLPLVQVFERVRLRVNDVTKGAEVPWHAAKIESAFVFFERAPDAPPPAAPPDRSAAVRAAPIRDLSAQEAYIAALERDTVQSYLDFLAAYPNDLMAKRVRAIIAARREAIIWRRTRAEDTPPAYWTYLRRYPRGPHAADAHRRLAYLAAALEPPPTFVMIEYDLPPPPPDEIIYVERPVLVFDDPVYAFAPPPPPPVYFLPPPPPEFIVLPPPPPPVALFVLPIPEYRPVPVWVRPPVYIVSPPANNVIFANVHNTVVINNASNTITVTNPGGQPRVITPPAAPAPAQQGAPPAGGSAAAPAPSIGPALPPSVARKAVAIQNQAPPGAKPPITGPQPQVQPGQAAPQPGQSRPPIGQPLPGAPGQPLPAPAARVQPGQTIPAQPPGAAPPAGRATASPTPAVTPGHRPGQTPTSSAGQKGPPARATATAPAIGPAPTTATPNVSPKIQKQKPAPTANLPNTPPPPAKTLQPQHRAPLTKSAPAGPPPSAKAPPPKIEKRPPPAAVRTPPPPPPATMRGPPPPPPAVRVARPPPPAARVAPPPRAAPPPPPAARAAPPPPPAARLAPPPPPPPRAAPPPPPAAARPAPPPAAAAAKRPPCGGPGQPPCPR